MKYFIPFSLSLFCCVVLADQYYDDSILPRSLKDIPQYERKVVDGKENGSSDSEVRIDLSRDTASIDVKKSDREKAAELQLRALREARKELDNAKAIRKKAERELQAMLKKQQQESDELIKIAEQRAALMEQETQVRRTIHTIDPVVVMNEQVPAKFEAATLKEIAQAIMPVGWTVTLDFQRKPELAQRRFFFRTTDRRDVALRNLFAGVKDARVYYQYFWDITDRAGNPAPELLITDSRRR